MATQLFSNDASSLLAASIDDNDLTIQVATGEGALFPNPGAGEYFLVTLENSDGDREVVKIESRATDLLTVAASGRGQEGTSAASWTNGQTRVELRLTKGTMENFVQTTGDAMSGDLDMDGNDIVDAVLSGSGTKMTAGEVVNVPLRGVSGNSSNEVRVPTDGTRATAGGVKILVETDETQVRAAAFEVGMITMWYGSALSVPAGWHLCNGSGGTPDLRDKFIVGAGSSYALSATGGSTSQTPSISASGGHSHGGVTGDHTLTTDEIPSHTHDLVSDTTGAGGGSNPDAYMGQGGSNLGATSAAGGGQAHSHSISAESDHTHTLGAVSTLPPYYGLYFIMYTG